MGQRLVVTVISQNKDLCKMYFHWSAYTSCALNVTKDVLDCIYNHEDETEREFQLRMIRFCEQYGGGIKNGKGSVEWKYIQNVYPNEIFKKEDISRNYGLIAISEEGMDDLQDWSEGSVYIDIDEDVVHFGVYCEYEDIDSYCEERKSWDDNFNGINLTEIPNIGYDLGCFNVSDIDKVIAAIHDANDWLVRNGNAIYELTE